MATIDIVIYVRGGNVQDICTNLADSDSVRVTLVDYDNGHDVDPNNLPDDCRELEDGIASVGPMLVYTAPSDVAEVIDIGR